MINALCYYQMVHLHDEDHMQSYSQIIKEADKPREDGRVPTHSREIKMLTSRRKKCLKSSVEKLYEKGDQQTG